MPGKAPARSQSFWRLHLVKALAVLFSGILFSGNCYISNGFPRIFLPLIGESALAFAWAAPAGILMGVGYALLGRAIRGAGPQVAAGARIPLVVGAALLATVVMLVLATEETVQFFMLLALLFPCAIMVFGALDGRLWAVGLGALLQLLIGLETSLDGQDIPGLLAYALAFVAAVELSYSSATMTSALRQEVAEAAGDRGRRWAESTVELAAGHYLWRFSACLAAAAFLAALALAIFGEPGLFGPAYAGSFEAYTASGLLLPGVAVLSVLALGLLVPHDLWARSKAFVARTRLSLRTPVVLVKPVPKEEELETF